MGSEDALTLIRERIEALHDEQRQTRAEVSGLRADLAAQRARVDERLDRGSRDLADHEARLRELKDAMPANLDGRLSALEGALERGRGKAAVVTVLLSTGGGATASAVVSWLLTRH